jgi:putative flippase GtrA
VKRLLHQFFRFLTVGVTNSVVDFGIFNVLLWIFPTRDLRVLVIYNSVAVALAIVNSYLWNTRFTFRAARQGEKAHRQRMLFIAQALFNVGVNDLVVAAFVRVASEEALMSPQLASNASKLVAMLVASLSSFLIMKYVVFV